VKDSKKVGQVKIVCFDEEEETLQAGPGRGHFATAVRQSYQFGYQAITLMNKYLNGINRWCRPTRK
jgi:ribose transport system substrate-binding protein